MTLRLCLPADPRGSRTDGARRRGARPARARAPRLAALALALGVATGAPLPAYPAPQRFAIDAAQSHVDFRIRYLGIFSLSGRFSHVTGVVVFDPDHGKALEVAIEIPVDSLELKPEFWRSELLSPRFFDVRRYPRMSFSAAAATHAGPDAGQTTGSLTLHGTTRPVALRTRTAPTSGGFEIEGETHVSRSAFGLGATLPFASDEVTVTLGIRAAPDAGP